jgi:hypothetical protein
LKLFRFWLCAASVIFFLASCATGPKVTGIDEASPTDVLRNDFSELAAGGSAYIYVDVPEMRPVLDQIQFGNISGADGGAKDVLDRTETGVIGMYPKESERSFMISANGKFPVFQSSIAMTFSPAWKKIKSETGIKYWRSEENNLSLALSSQKAYLSDGEPFLEIADLKNAAVDVPEQFYQIRKNAVMAGWVDKAGTKINTFLSNTGIPIQIPADTMLVGFYASTESSSENPLYDGTIHLEFPTVSQAKAVSTILGFAKIMLVDAIDDSQTLGKILKSLLSNSPNLDENIIKMNMENLNAEELASLFNIFASSSSLN